MRVVRRTHPIVAKSGQTCPILPTMYRVRATSGRSCPSSVDIGPSHANPTPSLLDSAPFDPLSLPPTSAEVIDSAFFVQRLRRALDHRQRFFPASAHYRLLNGEGDRVPGVLCDRYGGALCLQFASAAMEDLMRPTLVEAAASRACLVQEGSVLTKSESHDGRAASACHPKRRTQAAPERRQRRRRRCRRRQTMNDHGDEHRRTTIDDEQRR